MGPVANRGKGDLPQDPSGPALEDRDGVLYERSNQLSYLLVFAHPFPLYILTRKAETMHALNGDTGRPPCGPGKVHHDKRERDAEVQRAMAASTAKEGCLSALA